MSARPPADRAVGDSGGHSGGGDEVDLPLLPGEARAGRVLQQLVLGSALWVLGCAALAAILSGIGLWTPLLAVPLLLVLAGLSLWCVRSVPSRPLPLWSAGLLVAITLASGVWTSLTASEQVIPRRDAGSYSQSAVSLAQTHRRLIDSGLDAVAGAASDRPGITLASPGFYEVGSDAETAVQPQFVIGPAAVWSLGYWAAGPTGFLLLPAWAMALGVLAIGLLTAAVVGPRWAPLGAAGVALLFPVVHTARSTYSEPLATLTVAAGLLALAAAARAGASRRAESVAGLAGFLLGATTLVRIDALRETVLLFVVAALYAGSRRAWPRRLLVGAAGGTVVGFVAALVLSYRYVGSIAGSLVPLLALGLALGAAYALLLRAPSVARALVPASLAPRLVAALPSASAVGVVLVGLVLACRPLWMTARQSAQDPGSRVVAGLQLRQGLAVDGGRTYAEQTVAWLAWWVGPIALVVALLALAEAVRRVVAKLGAGAEPPLWAGPLVVAAGSTLLTLVRPGITPDHPWAERRLLIALPFVVVLVVAASAVVSRWATRRLVPGASAVLTLALAACLLVPIAAATWPHRSERVEVGSIAVIDTVCDSFHDGDVVLAVDSRAANEWPQVVRGWCGRPSLSTTKALRDDLDALRTTVTDLDAAVRANGGRLVLLSADSPDPLRDLGASARSLVDTEVLEDARLLERRPDHLYALAFHLWSGTLTPR